MKEQKVFIMKGVSCSGKSTYAQKLAEDENAVIISSDKIGEELGFINMPNPPIVFDVMEERTYKYLKQGKNVIVDATNLTTKRTNRWVQLAKNCNAKAICVFVNVDDEQLDKQMKERISTRWTNKSIEDMQNIKFQMLTSLQVPTLCDGFDDIILVQHHNKSLSLEWKSYFDGKEHIFIKKPSYFMHDLYHSGKMAEFIPELIPSMTFTEEHNNRTFTVFEHMINAADNLEVKTQEFIWAMLLHDIGKTYPRIKSFIAKFKKSYQSFKEGILYRLEIQDGKYFINGQEVPEELIITDHQFYYYGHENLSAQMAYRILERLGFSKNFIIKTCSYIQHHMAFSYRQKPLTKIIKDLQPIYEDLLIIRKANLSSRL